MRTTRYNQLGQRTQAPAVPFARQKLVTGADDATRVRQLEQQVRELERQTDASRSRATPRTVEMKMEVGKIYAVLRHGFGRRAEWRIVDWVPDVMGDTPRLSRVTHDDEANTLKVHCNTAGIYTIEIS